MISMDDRLTTYSNESRDVPLPSVNPAVTVEEEPFAPLANPVSSISGADAPTPTMTTTEKVKSIHTVTT